MNIDGIKRKIIDLRNQHKKKIREIVEIVEIVEVAEIIGKSSRDVTVVLKEYEIKQAQTAKDEKSLRGTAALKTTMRLLKACMKAKRYGASRRSLKRIRMVVDILFPFPYLRRAIS
jgi:hypothetical protein